MDGRDELPTRANDAKLQGFSSISLRVRFPAPPLLSEYKHSLPIAGNRPLRVHSRLRRVPRSARDRAPPWTPVVVHPKVRQCRSSFAVMSRPSPTSAVCRACCSTTISKARFSSVAVTRSISSHAARNVRSLSLRAAPVRQPAATRGECRARRSMRERGVLRGQALRQSRRSESAGCHLDGLSRS